MVPVNGEKLREVMNKFFKKIEGGSESSISQEDILTDVKTEMSPCPKCNKTFNSPELLMAHLEYSYEVCGTFLKGPTS